MMLCINCKNWRRVEKEKRSFKGQGLCSFLNSRIFDINANIDNKLDLVKSNENNSLVINCSGYTDVIELEDGYAGGESDSVHLHTWVWTDAYFFCAHFKKTKMVK